MFGDPELFDIETLKNMNMWPNQELISRGIIPYIKRIRKEKIAIAIIGDPKGENAVDILDNTNRIVKINIVNNYGDSPNAEVLKSVFSKNTERYKNIIDLGFGKKERDVICFDKSACTVENLVQYYDCVKSGGIVCGNGHNTEEVKKSLTEFRRTNRIGTPIQISYLTTWFWYKR